jgi:aldose 1-epimerase
MSVTKVRLEEKDNREVYLFTLTNSNGVSIKAMNLGCNIMEINVPDRKGELSDVALGFDNFEAAVNQTSYFGVVVGRFANRIEKSFFELNGKTCRLYANEGQNHLHGGKTGFNNKVWDAEIYEDKNAVRFHYLSPDGEEGYPGNLNVYVTYTLTDDNSLRIEYEAVSDADTVINLTNHSYFNLGGHDSGTIVDHYLKLNCDKYTECNRELIPTGVIADVESTPFDFREYHRIGDRIDADNEQMKLTGGYDHNFVINRKDGGVILAASLWDRKSGRLMEVYTDMPGVQFYTGNSLHGADIGKGGCAYGRRAGLCLETQFFPNGMKRSNFPSPVFKAGDKFDYTTVFHFSVDR